MLKQINRLKHAGSYRLVSAVRHLELVAARAAGKKNIFVATWQEGKNFGDDYLSLALSRYLKSEFSEARIIPVDLRASNYPLTAADLLVVGGGGLWGPHGTGRLSSRLYEAWLSTKAELIVAGIGIESFEPAAARQLTALWSKASFFSVRDHESWVIANEALGGDGVIWTADNTYLRPIQVDRQPRKDCITVNLCTPVKGGKQYRIEEIVSAVNRLSEAGYQVTGNVFSYQNADSDYESCKQVDPDCVDGFSVDPYVVCEMVIGMRFHSVLLALQNETPVIAINYSDKVKRLMCEYGLEDYCLEPDDRNLSEKLATLVKRINDHEVLVKIRAGNAQARQRLAPLEKHLQKLVTC
jgi:polysaccharide pyruvyl transferase WcaK-like protein